MPLFQHLAPAYRPKRNLLIRLSRQIGEISRAAPRLPGELINYSWNPFIIVQTLIEFRPQFAQHFAGELGAGVVERRQDADEDVLVDALLEEFEGLHDLGQAVQAEEAGLDPDEYDLYGKYKAKVSLDVLERLKDTADGKLICVTAITPTKAGEGKTTTSVSLTRDSVK